MIVVYNTVAFPDLTLACSTNARALFRQWKRTDPPYSTTTRCPVAIVELIATQCSPEYSLILGWYVHMYPQRRNGLQHSSSLPSYPDRPYFILSSMLAEEERPTLSQGFLTRPRYAEAIQERDGYYSVVPIPLVPAGPNPFPFLKIAGVFNTSNRVDQCLSPLDLCLLLFLGSL